MSEVQTSGRSLLELLPQVRPVRPQDLEGLRVAAARDAHRVVAPTHVIEKLGADGQRTIVGYISIGAITLVNAWVDSRQVKSRESVYLLNLAENLAAEKGARAIALPCAEDSPFHPYIGKLGYARLGAATYNVKVLDQGKE